MKSVFEITLVSLSLALDAVGVSVALGIKEKTHRTRRALVTCSYFGTFQFMMAALGWILGNSLSGFVDEYSKYIAFILLTIVAIKMFHEALKNEEGISSRPGVFKMISLSFATSLDAFVVGTSIALIGIPVAITLVAIGTVTFVLSFLSFFLALHLGKLFSREIEFVGAIAIFLIGFSFLFR